MCGLVAMFTTETSGFLSYDKDEFKQMLVVNSVRGSHSTGVAGVNMRTNHTPHLIKAVGSPYSLFTYNAVTQFFDKMVSNYTAVIGHGRFATKGEITAPNAHPFREGHITLAHNGVINNYWSLKDNTKHKDIEVDSHLIARMISEDGAINVLPRVTGAYVFIWYDEEEETFNIARNDARPLFGIKQTARNTLTFASEYQTLFWNGDRNNTGYDEVFEIAPMQIYSYRKDSLIPTITPYEQEKPYVAPVKEHKERTNSMISSVKTTGGSTIKVGSAITFTLADIESSGRGYYLVNGFSALYPNVIFRCSFRDIVEDNIYQSDYVTGIVNTIFPCRSEDVGYEWQVFVREGELTSEDADDNQTVVIENFNGGTENIKKYRLKQLADDGCVWCTDKIPDSDLTIPIKAQLFTFGEAGQSIVCSSCVEQGSGGKYGNV